MKKIKTKKQKITVFKAIFRVEGYPSTTLASAEKEELVISYKTKEISRKLLYNKESYKKFQQEEAYFRIVLALIYAEKKLDTLYI